MNSLASQCVSISQGVLITSKFNHTPWKAAPLGKYAPEPAGPSGSLLLSSPLKNPLPLHPICRSHVLWLPWSSLSPDYKILIFKYGIENIVSNIVTTMFSVRRQGFHKESTLYKRRKKVHPDQTAVREEAREDAVSCQMLSMVNSVSIFIFLYIIHLHVYIISSSQ